MSIPHAQILVTNIIVQLKNQKSLVVGGQWLVTDQYTSKHNYFKILKPE